MSIQILQKKFTVGQYHQMIESGKLNDRDRLIETRSAEGFLNGTER